MNTRGNKEQLRGFQDEERLRYIGAEPVRRVVATGRLVVMRTPEVPLSVTGFTQLLIPEGVQQDHSQRSNYGKDL